MWNALVQNDFQDRFRRLALGPSKGPAGISWPVVEASVMELVCRSLSTCGPRIEDDLTVVHTHCLFSVESILAISFSNILWRLQIKTRNIEMSSCQRRGETVTL